MCPEGHEYPQPAPSLNVSKQVAQRATIAHLSPMCQGQILFQKFKLIQALMIVLVTWKYQKDPNKNNREKVETPFSPL